MPTPRHKITRAAIAVIRRRGRFLICQRHPGGFFGGYWEFPGGKREPGESWEACVRREIQEELGVPVRAPTPFATMRYRYATGVVIFKVFRCAIARGVPRPLDAQALRWVASDELAAYRFPPANRRLLARLSRERG